jgi:hypothetical protein
VLDHSRRQLEALLDVSKIIGSASQYEDAASRARGATPLGGRVRLLHAAGSLTLFSSSFQPASTKFAPLFPNTSNDQDAEA